MVSEFVGIGAATELLGVSKYFVGAGGRVLIWYLVIFGSYARVEKILLLMTLVFFAYPVAAFLANPDWGEVARGAFIPTFMRTRLTCFWWSACSARRSLPIFRSFNRARSSRRAWRGVITGRSGSMLSRRGLFESDVDLDDHCHGSDAACCGPARNWFGG